MKVNQEGHPVQGTGDMFPRGNEACPTYHLKHGLCVPADPPTPLPLPTFCLCLILMDLYGSLLWLHVGLGQQDTGRACQGK